MKLINVGFGNIVALDRIISIVSPDSAPIKRLIQEAKDSKIAIDATYGRKTRAVIVMDSGHVVLSALQPETIASRIDKDIIAASRRAREIAKGDTPLINTSDKSPVTIAADEIADGIVKIIDNNKE